MATGRIGVTPTLRTRWSKQPSAGTTSLSGLDDNSVSLVYDVGYEAVYRNGVLLSRGNDYTATSGTSITLIDATLTGDIVEVFANDLVPLTDAISKGQFTAKGALLSATAASTPGVITVGANDTVLTADSTTSTGLKWATPVSGSMTLLSTTTLSGTSTTVTVAANSYRRLVAEITGIDAAANHNPFVQINSITSNVYAEGVVGTINATATTDGANRNGIYFNWPGTQGYGTGDNNIAIVTFFNPNATTIQNATMQSTYVFEPGPLYTTKWANIGIVATAVISSLVFKSDQSLTAGTVRLYGVN